jgi:hypothetical protein
MGILNQIIKEELQNLTEISNDEVFDRARKELSGLNIKELKKKVEEYNKEYKRYSSFTMWDKADEMLAYRAVANNMLERQTADKYQSTREKFVGQPFMGHKIHSITMPNETEDGEFKTFIIHLDDNWEKTFEYKANQFPKFMYYDGNEFYTQDLRKQVNPEDALLDSKDMKILQGIIRLYNGNQRNTSNKMPYPRQATLKGSEKIPQPNFEKKDFQWMIGKTDGKYKITDVNISNNLDADYGGFIMMHIYTEGDFILDRENYTYTVKMDAFYKPTEESLTRRFGISDSKDKKVEYLKKGLYEPITDAIKQINPQSKLVNKIRFYQG